MSSEAAELNVILEAKEIHNSPYKYIVAQTAPSVRVAFSEVFGHEPGAFKAGLLVSSLKELGFDLVLDTNTAADLTICEEGNELLKRILERGDVTTALHVLLSWVDETCGKECTGNYSVPFHL
jgi:iron only hydrogenase large subunit-like protein